MILYDDALRERLRANLAAFEPRTHELDGRRHAANHAVVNRLGNDVVATKLERLQAISLREK